MPKSLVKYEEIKMTDECEPFVLSEEQTVKYEIKGDAFREDVVVLRALAILSVLCFHLWPDTFRYGYLGVDVFFVISGFLMMRILKRSKEEPFQLFSNFYIRRARRIVPLYYFVMLLTGLTMTFLYTHIYKERYFAYYTGALLFITNFKVQPAGDYFNRRTTNIPFLHTWSLGVEMQFYAVAPFFFYLAKFGEKARLCHLVFAGCFLCSLYFQLISEAKTSFYHPMTRLWQFLCGMLTTLCLEKRKSLPATTSNSFSSVFLLIVILSMFSRLVNQAFSPNLLRILITISSSSFIYFATYSTISWSQLRLNHIARISYALYLVHFPVIRFAEYIEPVYELNSTFVPFATILPIFVISEIVHQYVESPLLRAKNSKIFRKSLKYFLLCLLIQWKWEVVMPYGWESASAVAANVEYRTMYSRLEGGHFTNDSFYYLVEKPRPPFGHYVYEGNTGKLKIVVFGNSWAAQQAHVIRNIFPGSMTAEFHVFSQHTCAFGIHNGEDVIKMQTPFLMEFLKNLQPNYVFFLLRYHDFFLDDLKPFKGSDDTIVEFYWQGIKNISKLAKYVFIEGHQPFECGYLTRGDDGYARFLDALERGEDLQKFNQPINLTAYYTHAVYQRLKIILERCSNCHLLDFSATFIDFKKNLLLTYDPNTKFIYMDNSCHLTEAGIKMLEKPFREAIKYALEHSEAELGLNATGPRPLFPGQGPSLVWGAGNGPAL
ncbi:unnamed protein product, partial [Mesorhabditis belari]|uniref:Acyl_transf_3 domain-containing protein n=1 Tax=Mesorhabditis belari TaxID=2138241 RepID=A0AAF3EKH3_9BILA